MKILGIEVKSSEPIESKERKQIKREILSLLKARKGIESQTDAIADWYAIRSWATVAPLLMSKNVFERNED